MGLFDFLKNDKSKADQTSVNNQDQTNIDRFEKELREIIPRYISTPGAAVNINSRHKETNEIIPFAKGFPEQFQNWKNVKSLADRRGIIYSLLDSQFGNQLELWQVIERFNDDRYPERALQIGTENKEEKDINNPNYWNALARSNFILTKYKDAKENCLNAINLDSSNVRTKRIYADTLHCTGEEGKAHELYSEIIKEKISKDSKTILPLKKLLGFDGDVVNSPLYAFSWLKADKTVDEDTWEWANYEFYYSPHFRSQYAFYLLEAKKYMQGFAKILQLSKEMPWFKDAIINSYSLIDQLNLNDAMQDEKLRLKSIIDKNNWT